MINVELHAPTEDKLADKVSAYQAENPNCNFKIYFCDYRKVWRASALRK
jgi:hypothetical protein